MPSTPLPPAGSRSRGVAGSAAVTAVSLLASMGLGAVLAVLVLIFFGKNSQTDAFFAAYGVFALLNAMAQGLRVSLVAPLVADAGGWAALDRFGGAILAVIAAAAVPLLVFSEPLAVLLVGSLGPLAVDTASLALILLWIASSLQLLAGLWAAAHGARGLFGPPAVAYVGGALVSITTLVVLARPLGIDAVALSIAAGSALNACFLLARLIALGYRPHARSVLPLRLTLLGIWRVLGGSLGYIVVQVTYVISLAYAARLGEGAVTLYAYAFFAALLLVAATAGPASMVLAGPLADTWDRAPRSLEPHLSAVTRAGLLLAVPAFATVAVVGDEVIDVVLGPAVNADEGDVVVAAALALSGFVAAMIAVSVPMVAAFASARYGGVGLAALLTVVVHLLFTAAVLPFGRLEGIGLATSASTAVFLAAVLWVTYGRELVTPAALVARDTSVIAAVGLAAFGIPWLGASALGGGLWQLAALAAGMLVFLALVRLALAQWWTILLRLSRVLVKD